MIAGEGRLPFEVASRMDTPPLVCAMGTHEPEGLDVDLFFSIERLVPFLRHITAQQINRIVLVGAVNRPRIDPSLFDPETAALVPEMLAALQGGDDAALRWIISLIEDFGIEVVGVADLAPHLLAQGGAMSTRAPTATEEADAARGTAILAALSPVDVGQGCAVASGLCLGVEAIYGTDALLANLSTQRSLREPQSGGVLIKRAKDGQDLRADLPTIGPGTIVGARQAQLTGICLQEGHVLILDREKTLADADEAGIALWSVP